MFGKIMFGSHGKFTSRNAKLLAAVEQGDVRRAEEVLLKEAKGNKAAADIDAKTSKGHGAMTALHIACEKEDIDMVRMLLRLGADPNVPANDNKKQATPLHFCASKGRAAIIEEILGCAATNTNKTNSDKETPLHLACRFGHFDASRAMIERSKDRSTNVNALSADYNTPLHFAVQSDNVDLILYLIEEGQASVDVKNKYFKTPLDVARERGMTALREAVQAWKKMGGDLATLYVKVACEKTRALEEEERKRRVSEVDDARRKSIENRKSSSVAADMATEREQATIQRVDEQYAAESLEERKARRNEAVELEEAERSNRIFGSVASDCVSASSRRNSIKEATEAAEEAKLHRMYEAAAEEAAVKQGMDTSEKKMRQSMKKAALDELTQCASSSDIVSAVPTKSPKKSKKSKEGRKSGKLSAKESELPNQNNNASNLVNA